MRESASGPEGDAVALRVVTRLTGVSAECLRAWERRHGAIEPQRTAGGTRRYRPSDLVRIKLLKAAVDGGERIGDIASLDSTQLERLVRQTREAQPLHQQVLDAVERLDGTSAQRLLSLQMASLGPTRFVTEAALPLMREIGEGWASGRVSIAAEHLATCVLRAQLGAALQPSPVSQRGPTVLFAAPPGERHELGLLMSAVIALGAGANPLYLGLELPVPDLLDAAHAARVSALALSVVTLPSTEGNAVVKRLRAQLPAGVSLWVGGVGAGALRLPAGAQWLATFEDLQRRVELLAS